MQASLIAQIREHPLMLTLSILLHLILLAILAVSLSHTQAPKMPQSKKIDTVKAVVIDASVVEQEVKKLRQAEENKRNEKLAEQKRLEQKAQDAEKKRRQEEKRLADLKRKQEQQKREQAQLKREQELKAKQLAEKQKAEKARKQKELEALKKQQQELERKKAEEQKKLAELEAKRKREEEAARQKKLAEEAEARRRQEELEMHQQMLEEERRLAKQSAENQRLLLQYISRIQRKVEQNWNAPASMVAGWSCEVLVEQDRFGDVQSVQMKQCTGSDAFKSTVERAVRKASPLPEAPNNDIFEKRLNFIFRPDV